MSQEVEKLIERLERAQGESCGCTELSVFSDAADVLLGLESVAAECVAWEIRAHAAEARISELEQERDENLAIAESWANAHDELGLRLEAAEKALEEIRDLEPREKPLPADLLEQIKACPECQRYADHPVQRGICDAHRRPMWDREKHDAHEERILGYRAKQIAREAIAKVEPR